MAEAFLLAQAVKSGWKRTLPAALGPLLSDGPILALVLLILTRIPQWYLEMLRIAGGLFILYLAREALRNAKKDQATIRAAEHIGRQNLIRASLINFLNPNPYIFWGLVSGPILVTAWRESSVLAVAFIALREEPTPGSEIASQKISSPRAMPLKYRSF